MENFAEYDDSTARLLDEYGEKLRKGEKPNPEDYIIRYSGSCVDSFKEGLEIQEAMVELMETHQQAIAPKGLLTKILSKVQRLITKDKIRKISKD